MMQENSETEKLFFLTVCQYDRETQADYLVLINLALWWDLEMEVSIKPTMQVLNS